MGSKLDGSDIVMQLCWFQVTENPNNSFLSIKRASQVALVVKNPPANAGDIRDAGSIQGCGRSPGEGHSNSPTTVFLLGETHGRGAWQVIVHRVAKTWT